MSVTGSPEPPDAVGAADPPAPDPHGPSVISSQVPELLLGPGRPGSRGPARAGRPAWTRNAWHDGTCLGTYLLAGQGGWERWYDAQGPVDTRRRTLALNAGPRALERLAQIPTDLRGLSLAGLAARDEDLQVVARRCRQLRWLDLRGTQVSAAGLERLRGIRSLRRIGVDPHLVLTCRPAAHQELVSGSLPLYTELDRSPQPDLAGLQRTLHRSVSALAESGSRGPDEAVARVRLLLDADRPDAALAVVAPYLMTGEPAVLIVAARCLLKQNRPAEALAALAPAPPTGAVLAWRAVVLTTLDPPEAARAARAALRETPENQVAEWALVTAYLNRRQLMLAEDALDLLRSRVFDEIDEAKLSARLARARGRFREESAAWHRLLAVVPDDADALAGLAHAQRCARPYSARWMRTLNRAAVADVGKYGERMTEQISGHRISTALCFGALSWPVMTMLCAAIGPLQHRMWGISLACAVLIGNLVGLALWFVIPGEVRRVIRNADRLTGQRRGPTRRWALAGVLVATAAVVFMPVGEPPVDRGVGVPAGKLAGQGICGTLC